MGSGGVGQREIGWDGVMQTRKWYSSCQAEMASKVWGWVEQGGQSGTEQCRVWTGRMWDRAGG